MRVWTRLRSMGFLRILRSTEGKDRGEGICREEAG